MGLLQRIKKGSSLYNRYFCHNCCAEVCYHNQQVVSILTIQEDGDVTTMPMGTLARASGS